MQPDFKIKSLFFCKIRKIIMSSVVWDVYHQGNGTACQQINLPEMTLYPVTARVLFDRAVQFCQERGQTLASLHDGDVIKTISDYFDKFKCGSQHMGWNVGLRITGYRRGSWIDGTEFNYGLHRSLFGRSYISSEDCNYPTFLPIYGPKLKNWRVCDQDKSYFLCSQPTTITTTTTTVSTTTVYNNEFGIGTNPPLPVNGFEQQFLLPLLVCVFVTIVFFSIFKLRKYRYTSDC